MFKLLTMFNVDVCFESHAFFFSFNVRWYIFFVSINLFLIKIKKIQIMKNIIELFFVHFIILFDIVISFYTSICMWNQTLLHHSIFWFRLFKYNEFNNYQNKFRQINFVAIDRFYTLIMRDWMHSITFCILIWFNQKINKQFFHNFFKFYFLSNKIVQSIWIFRFSIFSCQQFKSKILIIKICSKLKKFRRCEIQLLDIIVKYYSNCLNVVICIITHSKYIRLKF